MKFIVKKLAKKILKFLPFKRNKSAKVGASYSAFDGLENIEASLNSIRKNVDYINVVYQDISYHGEIAPKSDLDYLEYLKTKKLIDKILIFKCDTTINGRANEVNKRNFGLQDCKKEKCNYILIMDVDECFCSDEFEAAKNYVISNRITSTSCLYYYYLKNPCYRIKEPREFYVPFLQKITKKSKVILNSKQYCFVDPTRLLKQEKNRSPYVFSRDALICHHYAFVRLNIEKKYKNMSYFGISKTKQIKFFKNIINYKYPNDFKHFNGKNYEVIKTSDIFKVKQSFDNYVKFKSKRNYN